MSTYDAIIVGARPAGAATALLLARAGHRVLVLDRMRPGSDTLSTHALMRAGVVQLERWGLIERIEAAGTPRVDHVTFRYGDGVEVPVDVRQPLYAPRRTVLDPVVAAAAEQAGAEFRYGVRVTGLLRDDDGRVTGVRTTGPDGTEFTATAAITIGADGRRSLVAREVEAPITHQGHTAAATIYGYWQDVDVSGYEWLYGDRVAAGLIPTNGGVNVFVSMAPQRFHDDLRFDLDAAMWTVMAEVSTDAATRVAAGRRVSPLRGFAGAPGHLRRPHGPGWALVGDAGYFKDPGTAHGLSDALRDAELLARAIGDGLTGHRPMQDALADYETVRDTLSRPLADATEAIAGLDWSADELRVLHMKASDAMKHEVRHLLSLPPHAPSEQMHTDHHDAVGASR